jgi:hypothetical protein
MWPANPIIFAARGLPCCLFLFALVNPTSAQDDAVPSATLSEPVYGGTNGVGPDAPFSEDNDQVLRRHRDLAGDPCLSVYGYASPHVAYPNLFDHTIRANNKCAQSITIQVCYFRSEDCISMDVPGDTTKEAVLGIFPSMKDFRFEFRERL